MFTTFDLLTIQLILLPCYFLFLLSYLLIQICSRTNILSTNILLNYESTVVYSSNLFFIVSVPLLLLFVLLLWSIRAYEGLFFFSQLQLSIWHIKYISLLIVSYLISMWLFNFNSNYTTSVFVSELILGQVWLLWCLIWIILMQNLITTLFFLEILGVLILLIMFSNSLIESGGSSIQFFNNNYNSNFLMSLNLVNSFIFFIWVSAISILLLLWSSLYLYSISLTYELSVLDTLFSFVLEYNNFSFYQKLPSILFLLALLLKLAVVPFHTWLITFYSSLSLSNFIIYVLFYYIYILSVVFIILFGYLSAYIYVWVMVFQILITVSLILLIINLTETTTLRGFLSYSSIINISLLFITFLASQGV